MVKSGIFVVFLLFCCLSPRVALSAQSIELHFGEDSYRIELAQTVSERSRGLMYREKLEADRGMLLVYRRAGDHRIWMKNMRIALRVFWIDADFRVISAQRLEPCAADPCHVYAAPGPSRFVLELSDRDHQLHLGDRVEGLTDL